MAICPLGSKPRPTNWCCTDYGTAPNGNNFWSHSTDLIEGAFPSLVQIQIISPLSQPDPPQQTFYLACVSNTECEMLAVLQDGQQDLPRKGLITCLALGRLCSSGAMGG